MDLPVLAPEEIAALRDAMRKDHPSEGAAAVVQASPISLISDDRATMRARGIATKLGERLAEAVVVRVARLCGAKLVVNGVAAEVLEVGALREELARSWVQPAVTSDTTSLMLLAAGGPLVSELGAALLGAVPGSSAIASSRPSAAALRLFAPVGQAMLLALGDAWRAVLQCELHGADVDPDAWRTEFADDQTVAMATVEFGGGAAGRVRLIAPPEALTSNSLGRRPTRVRIGALRESLGEVPVEVRVVLGTTRLQANELAALRPGAVLLLAQSVDDLLPVSVGGVVSAYGKPVTNRGNFAVEIVSRRDR